MASATTNILIVLSILVSQRCRAAAPQPVPLTGQGDIFSLGALNMEWLDFWQQHRGYEVDADDHETLYWVFDQRGRIALLRQWTEEPSDFDYWIPDPQTEELLPSTLSEFVRLEDLEALCW